MYRKIKIWTFDVLMRQKSLLRFYLNIIFVKLALCKNKYNKFESFVNWVGIYNYKKKCMEIVSVRLINIVNY